MGLGNGNPNSGNKGSNWRYEYNVLKALECIADNTSGGSGGGCCPETNELLTAIEDNQTNGSQHTIVDSGSVSVTSIIPGTGATNLGKAEDAAHTSGDTGVMSLAVRNDNRATTFTTTNGDYSPIAVDSLGATFVNGTNATGAQTITSSTVTDDNTIAAGATSLGFATSSDFTGNINGVARLASTFYGFEAAVGRTLPAMTYTTTTGSITIDQII